MRRHNPPHRQFLIQRCSHCFIALLLLGERSIVTQPHLEGAAGHELRPPSWGGPPSPFPCTHLVQALLSSVGQTPMWTHRRLSVLWQPTLLTRAHTQKKKGCSKYRVFFPPFLDKSIPESLTAPQVYENQKPMISEIVSGKSNASVQHPNIRTKYTIDLSRCDGVFFLDSGERSRV